MSIQENLKHELKAVVLVTLFFATWLGMLMALKFLILEDYHIRLGGFSMVLIGALILAKVVLILDLLSVLNRHLGPGGLARVFLSPRRNSNIS